MEARLGSDDADHALQAVLHTAEILIRYAALLSLAFASLEQIHVPALAKMADGLTSRRKGPSWGDWKNILEEGLNQKTLIGLKDSHPLRELASLLTDKHANHAHDRLYYHRNAESHTRRPDRADVTEARDHLTALVSRSEFIADWTLVHITSVKWDTYRKVSTVLYRRLMGDYAIVPEQTITMSRNDIEADSLYIIDSYSDFRLLRPFLIGRRCSRCGNWSTFAADVDDRKLVLTSLEDGHVIPATHADEEALGQVGLLTPTDGSSVEGARS